MTTWDNGFEWGQSIEEVEGIVSTWLHDAVRRYVYRPTGWHASDKAAKWVASASLQKAIRRGDPWTARQMADVLHSIDPDYFWRRGRVIALEDIGIADLPGVAGFLWVSGKKAHRRKVRSEERAWMHFFVERFANTPKDRSCDDLHVCTAMNRAVRDDGMRIARSPERERIDILADNEAPVTHRAAALESLGGREPKDLFGGDPGRTDGSPAFAGDVARDCLGAPAIVEFIVRWGHSQPTAFNLTLPLVWSLAQGSTDISVTPECSDPMPRVGPWPAPGLDVHSAAGKRAIKFMALKSQKLLRYAMTHGDRRTLAKFIGVALFKAEGCLCDRRLRYDQSELIEEGAKYRLLEGFGHPIDKIDWVVETLQLSSDLLLQARNGAGWPAVLEEGSAPA